MKIFSLVLFFSVCFFLFQLHCQCLDRSIAAQGKKIYKMTAAEQMNIYSDS